MTEVIKNSTEGQVTLKEFLLKIKGYFEYLKTRWLIILFVGIAGGAIGFSYAYFKKITYSAILTFTIEEEKADGNGLAGALGLASSLGFDLGGGGGGSVFTGANLVALMKSRTLVEKALLSPVSDKQPSKSLATFFIEIYHLNKGWDQKTELRNIRFEPMADRKKFTLQQDSILGKMYQMIAGDNGLLSIAQKDKKVSIITVEVVSENELFSQRFTETITDVVAEFYITTKSKKGRYNFDILQKQTDSVRSELNAGITGAAAAADQTYNLNPALNVKRSPSARKQIDVQMNTAILAQLVANLEISKVSLRKETPLIQIIDRPILPLYKDRVSKIRTGVIFFILSSLAAVFVLVAMEGWRRVMKTI